MMTREQAERIARAITDEHVDASVHDPCGDAATAAIVTALLATRAAALEEATLLVRDRLLTNSQRAVSWHEVHDTIDAIRKLGEGT